jgi:hypothetical protein
LRKHIEDLVGRKCHFFLCLPSEFDQAIENISDVLSRKAEKESD